MVSRLLTLFIAFLLSFSRGWAQEAEQPPPPKKMDRLDLNQIDLEQVEEDWGSNPKQSDIEIQRSVRLKEIMEPTSEYNYASFGKPDPFLQPDFGADLPADATDAESVQSTDPQGRDILITSPLQAYPLNDLSVKGVWQLSTGEIRAMVATPKGEGIVVKEGDPISSGKVLSLTRERMQVRLYRLRSDGVREFQDQALAIGSASKNQRGRIRLEPGKEPVFAPVGSEPGADGARGLPATPAGPDDAAAVPAQGGEGGMPAEAPVPNPAPPAAPPQAVQAPVPPAAPAVIPAASPRPGSAR